MKSRLDLQAQERRSLTLALALSDLPGAGWAQVGEKSWRIGATFPREKDEAVRRAHHAGLYTGARFFKKGGLELGFSSQVAEYTSAEDAASRVRTLPAQTLKSHGRTVITQRIFEDEEVPGVDHSIVFEQFSAGMDGSGFGQYAGGCESNVLFLVACTTIEYGLREEPSSRWPWSELLALAALQSDKVRRLQNESVN